MVVIPGRIYGLCSNPMRVRGYLEVAIQVGTVDAIVEQVLLLDSTDPMLLLARSFMGRSGPVTFDWAGGRVKLARTWVAVRCLFSGATPLARVAVAAQEEEKTLNFTEEEWGLTYLERVKRRG